MSSFNSIEKIKYTDDLSDAVALNEYIVFGDERSERKYIVFKFSNNVNQKLLGMKFEVSQYDMHDNLIEKSVVIYNNFSVKPNSEFVPKAKLKVLYACKRISVKLLQAAFDRVLWNEGEYVDNSYKFEHYARDEKYIDETERPKIAPPPSAPRKITKDDTERFRAKNVTKKNIPVFPKVFYWLTSILLVVAIVVTVWLFPKFSKKLTISGCDLEVLYDNRVRLCGYEGEDDTIAVPADIDGYVVVEVGNGAFRRLPATKITLPESVTTVGKGAFKDMPNLLTVECPSSSVSVEAYAFENVGSLATFAMPGAVLVKDCFYGCTGLERIAFGKTDVNKYLDLIGTTQYGVIVRSFAGDFELTAEFFDGVRYIG